jgi:glycosyltransferase involved in cell wall biosynthesis/peptidoglycan/xylan/chitin deacetylase (PgdA/CDA1 family)
MKILWVKAGKLFPVDTGGKIRSYNILRRLAAANDVTFLSYYGGRRDRAYEREVCERLPGTKVLYTAARDATTFERSLEYLRRLPCRAPFGVTKFTSREVERLLLAWLDEGRFDVAVCDFLGPTLNFPPKSSTPVVLFQHNVESILWQRHAEHATNPIKRVAWKLEAAKMAAYERAALGRFDHVIAVSEYDREQMKTMTREARISVVPTGVDLEQYRAAAGESATEPLVMFLGSMDWEANIDGVAYFCGEIWPQVKHAVPRARFRIVGRNPHPRIKQLAADDIEVTGRVASVIEHLRQAAVFVVPLRIGGGTRLKIYEAMAMRKAVVSTTIGAEGLDVNHGRDILLADDPQTFADGVIELLRDPAKRMRFEAAAGEQAARYDWSMVTDRFEEALQQTVRDGRAANGVTSPSGEGGLDCMSQPSLTARATDTAFMRMRIGAEKRRVISLMYHDVIERAAHQASGFGSADAALYKLEPEEFKRHLEAIGDVVADRPMLVTDLLADQVGPASPWMITFDDGGASSYTLIADRLAALGWRAHFFIATDYISKPAFMTREQIRELRRRGHIIGSHSCSHPLRFAARPWNELTREWSESVCVLSDLLGEPVRIASVPGGQYLRQVAEAAAAAGIKALFTSEPTTGCAEVDGCLVLGRYAIQRWTSPAVAAGMARGQFTPRFRQWLWWEIKKITKTVGGDRYLRLRESWTDGLN